jgi:hypothetical protein
LANPGHLVNADVCDGGCSFQINSNPTPLTRQILLISTGKYHEYVIPGSTHYYKQHVSNAADTAGFRRHGVILFVRRINNITDNAANRRALIATPIPHSIEWHAVGAGWVE